MRIWLNPDVTSGFVRMQLNAGFCEDTAKSRVVTGYRMTLNLPLIFRIGINPDVTPGFCDDTAES